jgi:hypothetical protein
MAEISRKKRHGTKNHTVLVSRHQNRGKDIVVFYIGSDVLKDCKMEKGDKLDVMWDDKTAQGMILKDDAGKSLTVLDGGRGVLNFTWRLGMPIPDDDAKVPLEVDDLRVESDDEEIHFTFPKGCTF